MFHCPLCPVKLFKPSNLARVKKHIEIHWKNAIQFKEYRIHRCHQNCRPEGHYHCPFCSKTILRRDNMGSHLQACEDGSYGTHTPTPAKVPSCTSATSSSHSLKEAQAYSTLPIAPSLTVDPSELLSSAPAPFPSPTSSSLLPHTSLASHKEAQTSSPRRVKCPHCTTVVRKKNLPVHIFRKHSEAKPDVSSGSHLESVCVDATNGVCAVQRGRHGFSVPVHVQKKTLGENQFTGCELGECYQYHLLAQRSGCAFSYCEHIRSLDYCSCTASEEELEERVLDEMVNHKIFGVPKKNMCLKKQKAAMSAHVPLCVEVTLSGSSQTKCLSIYEPVKKHFSRLGRIMVTFNPKTNSWHCPCAKPRMSCVHKSIAKWHLFQTQRHLFETDSTAAVTDQPTTKPVYPATMHLERVVQYIFAQKKIPSTLPEEVKAPKAQFNYPTKLLPTETTCTFCSGRPALENPVMITNKARIVGIGGIIDDVSTYFRQCTLCQMVYRYQEWKAGLHNFDDHVVLTLELCIFLRQNLQNHTAVSRTINSLEGLRGVTFPSTDVILHAYCHFEALTSHDYTYSCVNCGYYPAVVIMDLHKKGVFSMAVSDLKEPPKNFNGDVNIEEFWNSVSVEMIARGFVPSRAKNPLAVNPSYEYWAPWIGRNTRKGDHVLNTEYEKVLPTQPSPETVR
ncbi:uncharacterized protein LOC143516123 [Brachyhypopomus gauderio]|uniref:uncharacterized protein LOC143516123 n=1 Tax=Brachyhypopomus gauderio TaxID=698409 RepID=UPI0040414662